MNIGERHQYAGGGFVFAGRSCDIIGSVSPLGAMHYAPNLWPQPIARDYGEGAIDQKLKEIDDEIAKINRSIDALRGVDAALCGAPPTSATAAELKPRVVENGLVDKLSLRKAELATAAETLLGLVTRMQTL